MILKGNASYLIRNCMKHRVNWTEIENTPENTNMFNFKWKELSSGIDYNSLNRNPGMKQIVNHYENHFAISVFVRQSGLDIYPRQKKNQL